MFRACITSISALAATLALAGGASATTFCVLPESSCAAPQTFPAVGDALTAAKNNPGGDQILLGAATYVAPTTAGWVYDDQTAGKLDIAGQGPATVLTGPSGATNVINIGKVGPDSVVHDLTVHLPASVPAFGEGIHTKSAQLSHITVDADPNQSKVMIGVALWGGSLDHSTVTLDNSGGFEAVGVSLENTNSTVSDSSVSSSYAIEAINGGTVDRVRVAATVSGIEVINVAAVVRNCLVNLLPSQLYQAAIRVNDDATGPTIVNCTLVGNGSVKSFGIQEASGFTNSSADVANVLIHGVGSALSRWAGAGLQSTLAIRNSDYDPSNLLETGSGAITQGAGNGFHSDPGFVDEAGGDYRLVHDSPLIDAGDPVSLFGTGDVNGWQRNADGDGTGGPAPDIGGFEYQRSAPQPKIQGPSSGQPGDMLSWSGSGVDSDGGESSQLTFGWKVDGGPLEPGAMLEHTFTAVGTHHVVLVVVDPAGVEAELDYPVQIGASGGGGGGGGGSSSGDDPAPAADSPKADVTTTQAPSSADPQPPVVGPAHLAPVISRLRVGRWVRLTVDKPATIDIRIERRSKAAASLLVRHRRVAAAKAGRVKIRLGHLRPGRYRIVVTATDAFGNRSAPKARKLVRR